MWTVLFLTLPTRARPWVDRLACAWLILRFVDRQASFVLLDDPSRAPRGVLGFEHDGARVTHVGAGVTFEAIAAGFGLDADALATAATDVFAATYAAPGAHP